MAEVVFQNLTKVYPGGTLALDDLSLEIADGEFMILVGPSGCGKTTALRCVAGLERPSRGRILIDGRVVNTVSPHDRDIAMVFQNYALYPHLSVAENIAFGLRLRKTPKQVIEERVVWAANMLDLTPYLARRPKELSGGQRQRVAMGRAIVRQPQAFLMDEPLSNLDAKLRVQMRAELKRLHRRLGITTIYVTHDQVEAMTLGDRIAVMSAGRPQQVGTPQDVYDQPVNLFVAGFIGSPAMNLVRGQARGGRVVAGDLTFDRPGVKDGDLVVGIRPEALSPAADGLPSFDFLVDVVEPLGDEVVLHGTAATTNAVACVDSRVRPTAGSVLRLGIDPADVHVFHADSGAAIR